MVIIHIQGAVAKVRFSANETVLFTLETVKSQQSSDSLVIGESLLCVFGHWRLALEYYGQGKYQVQTLILLQERLSQVPISWLMK
ncbi:hypothetical protein B4V02_14495 [Paenibacillus kribbensis]|uniref:Uncharacterized protein n=1 Tax=Paenibacillus kribbensis TaxID=172713 RepID=A0A222WPF2_9BACL|nr:hypothetical protein B4V02_14495 [Paenibacillus kribbensis]